MQLNNLGKLSRKAYTTANLAGIPIEETLRQWNEIVDFEKKQPKKEPVTVKALMRVTEWMKGVLAVHKAS